MYKNKELIKIMDYIKENIKDGNDTGLIIGYEV